MNSTFDPKQKYKRFPFLVVFVDFNPVGKFYPDAFMNQTWFAILKVVCVPQTMD